MVRVVGVSSVVMLALMLSSREGGDLGEGGDVGVVEGVDPPEYVLAGPVSHEPAADGVLDPRAPCEVGGEALAQ